MSHKQTTSRKGWPVLKVILQTGEILEYRDVYEYRRTPKLVRFRFGDDENGPGSAVFYTRNIAGVTAETL